MYTPKEPVGLPAHATEATEATATTSSRLNLLGLSHAEQTLALSPTGHAPGAGTQERDWPALIARINTRQRAIVHALMSADHATAAVRADAFRAMCWSEEVAATMKTPAFKAWAKTGRAITVWTTLTKATASAVGRDYVGAMSSVADGIAHLVMGSNPWTVALDTGLTEYFGADWPSRAYKGLLELFTPDYERSQAALRARGKDGLGPGKRRR
jgi:hypothetical protein